MIASVKRGLYAPNFGGGQVDITSGKFVFSASEAYLIEDGKITRPVKGATLIGNGPETMNRVSHDRQRPRARRGRRRLRQGRPERAGRRRPAVAEDRRDDRRRTKALLPRCAAFRSVFVATPRESCGRPAGVASPELRSKRARSSMLGGAVGCVRRARERSTPPRRRRAADGELVRRSGGFDQVRVRGTVRGRRAAGLFEAFPRVAGELAQVLAIGVRIFRAARSASSPSVDQPVAQRLDAVQRGGLAAASRPCRVPAPRGAPPACPRPRGAASWPGSRPARLRAICAVMRCAAAAIASRSSLSRQLLPGAPRLRRPGRGRARARPGPRGALRRGWGRRPRLSSSMLVHPFIQSRLSRIVWT